MLSGTLGGNSLKLKWARPTQHSIPPKTAFGLIFSLSLLHSEKETQAAFVSHEYYSVIDRSYLYSQAKIKPFSCQDLILVKTWEVFFFLPYPHFSSINFLSLSLSVSLSLRRHVNASQNTFLQQDVLVELNSLCVPWWHWQQGMFVQVNTSQVKMSALTEQCII